MDASFRLYDPLLDFRQVSFILNINDQSFELAILSFIIPWNDENLNIFYVIFKPTEYDHVIHLTPMTPMWNVAKKDLERIFKEVCSYDNLNIDDFPEVVSFINKD